MEEAVIQSKKVRNFPTLDLKDQSSLDSQTTQPVLVIQSPKTPTLSRKLKAVSLDAEPPSKPSTALDITRDVISMPNTPKKQIKTKLLCEFVDNSPNNSGSGSSSNSTFKLSPLGSNLKKFASNTSISGSQTLKTLPEIMTLQDFTDNNCHSSRNCAEPPKMKAKGLLERRGSNASLTIDLGSNSSISDVKSVPLNRLNTAKSVSNLNLSSFGSVEKCMCQRKCEIKVAERRKSQEACGNCIIYESPSSRGSFNKLSQKKSFKCSCCIKSRRKSLSNENLYVPPCGFCQTGFSSSLKECTGANKHCKGYRKACYPRQPDLESSQLLTEDFKLHLKNIQYLQTAGNVLSVDELRKVCQMERLPKLHKEFWDVPINFQEKCYVSGSQNRNRYKEVFPNEHSRVHLPGSQSYIHANYIKGPDYTETAYIATQGPMAHTCEDFWEMVWYTNCRCIVMLTGLVEKGRNKCELYFPLGKSSNTAKKTYLSVKTSKAREKFTFDVSSVSTQIDEEIVQFEELNELTFGKYHIKYVKKESLGECDIRQFELKRSDDCQLRLVCHYWFSDWPDHKMANPQELLDIALHLLHRSDLYIRKPEKPNLDNTLRKTTNNESQQIDLTYNNDKNTRIHSVFDKSVTLDKSQGVISRNKDRKKSTDHIRLPIIVHCSAGIGRTGCFLAILNGIQQLKTNSNVDVLAILCSLRLNRGGMVQTAEQYELIHRVLSLYTEQMDK